MGRSHSHVSQNVIKISMGFITIFEILQNGFFLYQFVSRSVVIKPLTPQSGQTHSNNSSAVADESFECA